MRLPQVSVVLSLAAILVVAGCQPKVQEAVAPPPNDSPEPISQLPGNGTADTSDASKASPTAGAPQAPTSDPSTAPAPTDATSPSSDTAPATPPSTASANGPMSLRFAFDKGAAMTYASDISQEASMPGSKGGSMQSKMATVTDIKVLDVTSGKANIQLTSSKITVSGGDGQVQKAEAEMAKKAEGTVATMTIDPFGKPSNLKYTKGDKGTGKIAGFDFDTGFFSISYPDKKLKPGDTWTHSLDFKDVIGAMMPMTGATWKNSNLTTTFTLQSIQPSAGTATISMSLSGNPSMSMKMPDLGSKSGQKMPTDAPKEMKVSFIVKGSGTATVEIRTGLPKLITFQNTTDIDYGMGKTTQKQSVTVKRTK